MTVKVDTMFTPDVGSFKASNENKHVADLVRLDIEVRKFEAKVLKEKDLEINYEPFQEVKNELLNRLKTIFSQINWIELKSHLDIQRFVIEANKSIGESVSRTDMKLHTALNPKMKALSEKILLKKEVEGIFRVSGDHGKVKQVVEKSQHDLNGAMKEESDVHVLAGTLKQLLRERSPRLFDSVKGDLFKIDEKNNAVQQLKEIVAQLESKDAIPAKTLFLFLFEIAANAEQNKMPAGNIATCIAPNLVTLSDGMEQITELQKINSIVAGMIANSSEIFQ